MFDLAIRGATLVTAEGMLRADLGIAGGRVACIADTIADASRTIEADGLWLLPGGVDSHCHIEEPNPDGTVNEENFESASRSALAGGTTSVVCFVPQWKGQGILPRLDDQMRRARAAMVDVAFHQIITDPTDDAVDREIPEAVARGVRSLKVFLTYDEMHVTDAQYIRVLRAAKRHGCLVTVHCENYDAIRDRTAALLAAGHVEPRYHATSRPPVVEREATHRAIALAEMVGTPIQVFHVSCAEAAEEIARAQARGVAVWGETCPQYVTLTAADMNRPGFEGAKYMCSPAPRDAAEHARVWAMIRRGVLDVVSSDHCAFSFEGPHGKRRNGADASFDRIPNGIPGLAARLPLLFSEGVSAGRITPEHFVRLSSTNPAKLMGLWPRKGGLHVGSDADAVLWDPLAERLLTNTAMQHAIDYTPYEGRRVTGWPKLVLRRGEVAMQDDVVRAQPGSGAYLPRGPYAITRG
jgi:dihydropyrimidinase